MMIGESPRLNLNPTIQVPPWDSLDDPMVAISSPYSISNCSSPSFYGNAGSFESFIDPLSALHRYLPSNEFVATESEFPVEDKDMPVDAFSSDHFRMYEFKVRMCARGRSHDWTECPYAHPGEKARRRDPRKYHYSGTACPELRKGSCKKGDSCEFAHGVFECWLHPSRYRTQPCKDGMSCRRPVCFFAHSPEQLRGLPQQSPRSHGSSESFDGSPIHPAFESTMRKASFVSSPTSILIPPSDSPPTSPNSPQVGVGSFNTVSELAASMRNMHVGKMKMGPQWGQMGPSFGSLRNTTLRPGFHSMLSTPMQIRSRSGVGPFDLWDQIYEEEPAMERVESGKDLRAQIYAKLSKENSLDRVDSAVSAPDFGWVSELVK